MAFLARSALTAIVLRAANSPPDYLPLFDSLGDASTGQSAAVPATSTGASTTAPAQDACATVASLASQQTANDPTVPAQVAWDCLQTVPLEATAGAEWIDAMKPYLEWQTTTQYLKRPPSGYTRSGMDLLGGLDRIAQNISTFSNEYEFEWSMYQLFASAYDGHFRYVPTLVGGIVNWGRPVALVSVSSDGLALPQLFVYSDIVQSAGGAFEASPVTKIDGQAPQSIMDQLNSLSFFQDQDAAYNTAFVSLAQISKGSVGIGSGMFSGGGTGALVYPGATTTLTFANGTTRSFDNFATVLQNFTGIHTGQDVYDRFLNPPPSSPTEDPTGPVLTPVPVPSSTSPPGYPKAVVRHPNNLISGYYLDGSEHSDVAILSIPSFVSSSTDEQAFQDVAFDFIAGAKTAGKTKLIIDLGANGGGTVTQAHSLFTNLFPDLSPYGGTRWRAHEAFNLLGQVVSDVVGDNYPFDYNDPPPPGQVLDDLVGLPFIASADLDANNKKFTSWSQKYGPHEFYGDNFSSIIRFDLDDPLNIVTGGFVPNGHGDRTGLVTERAFEPEDIILLTDGYCASTCAVFAEMMTSQGGVKTVAVGGRPSSGPMQAIGGTKGANVYTFSSISSAANTVLTQLATTEQQASLSALLTYSSVPLDRAVSATMNVRDNTRLGDTTQTPLQFVYEAADCRIFYEADMLLDMSRLWERAADVAWRAGGCVNGDVGLGAVAAFAQPVESSTSGWFGKGWFSFRVKSQSQKALSGEGKSRAMPTLKVEDRKTLVNSWEVRTDPRALEDNPGLIRPL